MLYLSLRAKYTQKRAVNPVIIATNPALYFCDLSSPFVVTSPAEHDVHKQLKQIIIMIIIYTINIFFLILLV